MYVFLITYKTILKYCFSTLHSYLVVLLDIANSIPLLLKFFHPGLVCSGYAMKLHLTVRLQSWIIWGREVTLHNYYSQVHVDPEWQYLLESYLWVK